MAGEKNLKINEECLELSNAVRHIPRNFWEIITSPDGKQGRGMALRLDVLGLGVPWSFYIIDEASDL